MARARHGTSRIASRGSTGRRSTGSPNLWLIIPLLIASVLLLGWIVGTLATTDLAVWARNLVRQKSPF
ncbi:MAG: hypothetical protein ACREIY_03780 [Candidatus Rokuibacteriota bacterium]